MKKTALYIGSAAFMLATSISPVTAAGPDNDPVTNSIQTEIKRGMEGLKLNNVASPCFISYRANFLKNLNIKATLGALVSSNAQDFYSGFANVIVGDYDNNNQHAIFSNHDLYDWDGPSRMVFGADDQAIRTEIWNTLDEKYKTAAERYNRKQSILKQMEMPEDEKNIPDFRKMDPVNRLYPVVPLVYNQEKLNGYIKEASGVFAGYKEINDSHVRIYAGSADVRYCNSEGSVCRYPNNMIALLIYTKCQAKDGEEIVVNNCYPYDSFDKIPTLDELKALCHEQARLILEKKNASQINEAYVGPVLFAGEAVVDLIRQLLVNNRNGIISMRKSVASSDMRTYYDSHPLVSGNNLEAFMNKKVISRDLSLVSMSGTPEYKGEKLFGYYPVDDEGVSPDKECVLIQDGVLVNMLSSRTPGKYIRQSNGHARMTIDGMPGGIYPGVLRLSSKQTLQEKELKEKLITAAREEDYPYAYIIRKLDNDQPTLLYRVDVTDGTETPVRGAIVKDLLVRSLKRVLGVSADEKLYNRIYNDIKTSYIVPSSLLLEEVDIVKNTKIDYKKPYIVNRPE